MTPEEFVKIRRHDGHLTPNQSKALIAYVGTLTDAVQWIVDCWGAADDDYCRADMQGAIDNAKLLLLKKEVQTP
jgi:hypothetical protein